MEQRNPIIQRIISETSKVILGKESVIQLTLAAFLAGGHVLYEDVPGIGKTMLVRSLSRVMGLQASRVQFTPDMMPSDIIGISIFNTSTQHFEFKKGPIFTDILLADEINRTTPRTQSALLEAMSEGNVSQDGVTYSLGDTFFVLATQNPSTYEGTYPLPEAQLDRFIIRLSMGYPTYLEELDLLESPQRKTILPTLQAVASREDIMYLKDAVDKVTIKKELYEYALDLVRQTRKHSNIRLGVSPRGALDLVRVAKAYAVTQNRDYCIPEDFSTLFVPVCSHRVHTRSAHDFTDRILEEILANVKAPVQ
ncbi:AAA family ATPase [Erysipelothrix larvae]|uniref:AAA family ATPase n=1 Tax=Erysipelothrix larvae TaxID=1514105 RepID=A0A109UGH4_9FIRM|nr:MoxR family ATPase [Erysipelothrix larvae]AMC92553.1 AAA family ATPase [Erysipelothrix larvae]